MKKISSVLIASMLVFGICLLYGCNSRFDGKIIEAYNAQPIWAETTYKWDDPNKLDFTTYRTENYNKVHFYLMDLGFFNLQVTSYEDFVLAFETFMHQCNNTKKISFLFDCIQQNDYAYSNFEQPFREVGFTDFKYYNEQSQISCKFISSKYDIYSVLQQLLECDYFTEITIVL